MYRPLLKLFTDGGARPNPGHGGAGAVLFHDEKIVSEISRYLGSHVTNNVAEYQAFIFGLKATKHYLTSQQPALGLTTPVQAFLDSNLVVNQVNGAWKVKEESLRPYFAEASFLMKEFGNLSVQHIRRSGNSLADALATKAINEGKLIQ